MWSAARRGELPLSLCRSCFGSPGNENEKGKPHWGALQAGINVAMRIEKLVR